MAENKRARNSSNRSVAASSPIELEMPVVEVKVTRFAKHPSGHTVYECVIEVPQTRQVCMCWCYVQE